MGCEVLCVIGDNDQDSLLNSHTSSRKNHLTGEVGAMVLEPGCEGQHRGEGGPRAQGCEGR